MLVLAHTYITAQVITAVAPLKAGNKWVYYSNVVFQGEIKKYEVLDSVKIINGISFFSIFNTPYNDVTYMAVVDNEFYARYDESMKDSLYKYFKTNPQKGDTWEHQLSFDTTSFHSTIVDTFSSQVFSKNTLIYVVDRVDTTTPRGSREYWTEKFGMLNGLYEQAEDYLLGCVINGVLYGDTTTTIVDDFEKSLNEFLLYQNYPNPFNITTKIAYKIPEGGNVKLMIYDVLGNEVAELVNENKDEGNYTINFDASNIPSGVYIYTFRVNDFTASKKMTVLK